MGQILNAASRQLFSRSRDQVFSSFDSLYSHCAQMKAQSSEHWHRPAALRPTPMNGRIGLQCDDQPFEMNDWSFGQMCKLANVSKDTVNRLSPQTACQVLGETLPDSGKPLQLHAFHDVVRSVHGASYTRLYDVELLSVVREYATDFQPPQTGIGGATGLYCGEQDLFIFMIDPLGWIDIEGEAFAPGFFLWNSEVGCRSVGIQTFWFQKVCQNHLVWDAVEVVDFTRKHTASVRECLDQIRGHIERLVKRRDDRKDGFAKVMANAFKKSLGSDAEEVAKVLHRHGIPRDLAKQALKTAESQGGFTIFSLVDTLTRIAGQYEFAGARSELDEKAGTLLALAAE